MSFGYRNITKENKAQWFSELMRNGFIRCRVMNKDAINSSSNWRYVVLKHPSNYHSLFTTDYQLWMTSHTFQNIREMLSVIIVMKSKRMTLNTTIAVWPHHNFFTQQHVFAKSCVHACVHIWFQRTKGLYSLSGNPSYIQISWSLEAEGDCIFIKTVLIWYWAGISAVRLPMCLSVFRAIKKV